MDQRTLEIRAALKSVCAPVPEKLFSLHDELSLLASHIRAAHDLMLSASDSLKLIEYNDDDQAVAHNRAVQQLGFLVTTSERLMVDLDGQIRLLRCHASELQSERSCADSSREANATANAG